MFTTPVSEPRPPFIKPWKVIPKPPDFASAWVVTGDLDGDGEQDFVMGRNVSQHVTTVVALMLDGSVLWTWGGAGAGDYQISYDLPLQVFDIDGCGHPEVLFSTGRTLRVLRGFDGDELARWYLPRGLEVADCITFADFRGFRHPQDIIVKNRYTKLWSFTNEWDLLWEWPPDGKELGNKPFGMDLKTCHHPEPFDLDGDGKDEVLAGNVMLDHDGSELWEINADSLSTKGHLDAARVVRTASDPADVRMLLTYCGGNVLAMIDGNGQVVWEHADGKHYESIDVGPISPDGKLGLYVDITSRPYFGNNLGRVYDIDGNLLGEYAMDYSRHHRMVDWDGDGACEIVLGNAACIVDTRGNQVASLDLGPDGEIIRANPGTSHDWFNKPGDAEPLVSVLPVVNRGATYPRWDVVLHTRENIHIYTNPSSTGTTTPTKQFTSTSVPRRDDMVNFTLY
ncbi:MAG: hypothetical protein GYA24_23885 [Candidatus Lokiarchaeota archaeon]|nr:hypothetical protein [Candidatus Lokiarchaeota archaeon]